MVTDEAGGVPEKLREWSTFIGITISIIGNVFISFALNIQRLAHLKLEEDAKATDGKRLPRNQRQGQEARDTTRNTMDGRSKASDRLPLYNATSANDDRCRSSSKHRGDAAPSQDFPDKEDEPTVRKSYLKSPYWWGGIILMTFGEAGNFLAYGFAPASIVSPLGVVALVSNCIIAPCLLKEKFRQRDLWGVIIAVAGTVTIVLSAKVSTVKMGPDDVWQAITRWEFETYMGVTAALILALLFASEKYGERTILIDLGLVSMFGGYTALATKGVASLLSDTLWRALTYPITYLLVLVLVSTALLQIRYVNRALQRFDSTQVIPIQFVLFTLSVIIGSAILYRDFEAATIERVFKFVGGCLLTFLGVYFITSKRGESSTHGREDVDREERAIDLVVEGPQTQNHEGLTNMAISEHSSLNSSQDLLKSRRTSSIRSNALFDDIPESQVIDCWPSEHQTDTEDLSRASRPILAGSARTEPSSSTPLLSKTLSASDAQSSQRLGATGSKQDSGLRPPRPRRSITRLAPYTSPLSSSLSAIIADQRRRSDKAHSDFAQALIAGTSWPVHKTTVNDVKIGQSDTPDSESADIQPSRSIMRRKYGTKSIGESLRGFLSSRRGQPSSTSDNSAATT